MQNECSERLEAQEIFKELEDEGGHGQRQGADLCQQPE